MSGFEVSGKKGKPPFGSQRCASAENFNLFCQPCDEDHKRVEACGFCVECKDYLCGDCIQYHRTFRATRTHIILNKKSMPKDGTQVKIDPQPKDVCTEPCTKHHGKVLEYYCEPHDEFECSVCVTLGHTSCEVGYIPKLAKGIVNSNKYKEMLQQIDNLQQRFEKTKELTSKSIAEVESESEAYTDKVTKLGEELINRIKQLMQTSLDEKDEFVKKLLVKLNNSRKQSQHTIEEIRSMKTELESKNNSDIESFVSLKMLPKNINVIQDRLKKTYIESKPMIFQFTENPELLCVKGIKTFGKLRTYKKIAEQLDHINISTDVYKKTTWISGIAVLSDGRLAIVDEANKSVKLVDTNKQLTLKIQLQHEPWGITEVSKGQLAVTVPKARKIQFLTVTDRTVKIEHLIETGGECRGIAAHREKLVVGIRSYPLGEVQILDLSGRVLRRITYGDNGKPLCESPSYIAVNPSNNLIYVTDSRLNTLTCVTMEGNVKFVSKYKYLHGLAIDNDGSVFVCGANGIEHITETGKKIQTLLEPGQEGANSFAIVYDKNTGSIFLGSLNESLTVYHLD